MIFITGDIHADPRRFSSKNFPTGKELTKDDYVIILGDFGLVWDQEESEYEEYWLNWLDNKPWTTLFIAGNHENFDRLEKFPIERWNGGRVSKIRPSILYLQYGDVFELEGKRFLSLGGARSHDIDHGILDPADYETEEELVAACREIEYKHGGKMMARYRIKGVSWWEQELPTWGEIHHAFNMLLDNNYRVDYVLSHEAPADAFYMLSHGEYKIDSYSNFLEQIRNLITYKMWFFGHYHVDKYLAAGCRAFYEDIYLIETRED